MVVCDFLLVFTTVSAQEIYLQKLCLSRLKQWGCGQIFFQKLFPILVKHLLKDFRRKKIDPGYIKIDQILGRTPYLIPLYQDRAVLNKHIFSDLPLEQFQTPVVYSYDCVNSVFEGVGSTEVVGERLCYVIFFEKSILIIVYFIIEILQFVQWLV